MIPDNKEPSVPPMTFPPEYPEVLADLATLIHQRLCDLLLPAVAANLARDLVEEIRLKWGGGLIYIPQGARFERQQRDAAIWREFDGGNHADLARRHGLTLSCIYDILSRERARRKSAFIFRPGE